MICGIGMAVQAPAAAFPERNFFPALFHAFNSLIPSRANRSSLDCETCTSCMSLRIMLRWFFQLRISSIRLSSKLEEKRGYFDSEFYYDAMSRLTDIKDQSGNQIVHYGYDGRTM